MRINGILRPSHETLETSGNEPEVAFPSYSFARTDSESGAASFVQASIAAFDLQALAELGVQAGRASAAEAKALQRYEISLCNAQMEHSNSAPDSLHDIQRYASDYRSARKDSDAIARQVADIVRGIRRTSASD